MGVLSGGVVIASTALRDSGAQSELPLDQYVTAQYRTVWVDPTADEAETYEQEFWARVATNQQELKRSLQADPSIGRVAMGQVLPGLGHPFPPLELEGSSAPADGAWPRVARANVDVDFFAD